MDVKTPINETPFMTLHDYDLATAEFNKNTRRRIIIIRHLQASIDDEWLSVPGTNIIVIGGSAAIDELRRYVTDTKQLRYKFPGGLSSSTEQNLRHFLL